jgi:hypothetical protein
MRRLGQSIVFTSDNRVTRTEKERVFYSGASEQDVLCINEKKVMVRSKNMYHTPNTASEGIKSDLSNRPTTSAGARMMN